MIQINNGLYDTYILLFVFIHSLSECTFSFAAESQATHNNSIFFQNTDQLSAMKNQVIQLLIITQINKN